MSDDNLLNDYQDFDQEWFYDEIRKNSETHGTHSELENEATPPGPSASHNHVDGHPQMASGCPGANYQEPMDPSGSEYCVSQPPQPPLQQQQQQMMEPPDQQRFETLQTFNPNQSVQSSSNHYQDIQPMDASMYDVIDYMPDEATTSTAMPMECGMSQAPSYESIQPGQFQQQQTQPCQMNSNEGQWVPVEVPCSSQMSQPQQQQMATVVYTSSAPRIPDPGGQANGNLPQLLSNFNPQPQIIQTGPNGEVLMHQVSHHSQMISQSQQRQQQFNIPANGFVQQQIAYVQSGNQFIATQPQGANAVNGTFHQQPMMQVIQNPQHLVQPVSTINEIRVAPMPMAPVQPTPTPPQKPRPPRTKPPAKKKAQGQTTAAMVAPPGAQMEFRATPEVNQMMSELMVQMSILMERENNGENVEREKDILTAEMLRVTGLGDEIGPPPLPPSMPVSVAMQPMQVPISAPIELRPTTSYQPVAPKPPVNKKRTKQEQQQMVPPKKAALIPPSQMPVHQTLNLQEPMQMQASIDWSDAKVVSQGDSTIILDVQGKKLRAVMVGMAHGTPTYQIQNPPDGDAQILMNGPPILNDSMLTPKRNVKIESNSMQAAMSAVNDVVESLEKSSKSIASVKKTPMRTKNRKATDDVKKEEPVCPPSTSTEVPLKNAINMPAMADMSRRVNDQRENRRVKVAELLKNLKDSLATVNVESPFKNKQDVFNRLIPYTFHLEPFLSDLTMEKLDHELFRHRISIDVNTDTLKSRLKTAFVKEAMKGNEDLEVGMLSSIDLEYERRQFERDKEAARRDLEEFVNTSEILKCDDITLDQIGEAQRKLNERKPKPYQKLSKFPYVFEPSHFNEEDFRRRRNEVLAFMEKQRLELEAWEAKMREPSLEPSTSPEAPAPPPVFISPPPVHAMVKQIIPTHIAQSEVVPLKVSLPEAVGKVQFNTLLKSTVASPKRASITPSPKVVIASSPAPMVVSPEPASSRLMDVTPSPQRSLTPSVPIKMEPKPSPVVGFQTPITSLQPKIPVKPSPETTFVTPVQPLNSQRLRLPASFSPDNDNYKKTAPNSQSVVFTSPSSSDSDEDIFANRRSTHCKKMAVSKVKKEKIDSPALAPDLSAATPAKTTVSEKRELPEPRPAPPKETFAHPALVVEEPEKISKIKIKTEDRVELKKQRKKEKKERKEKEKEERAKEKRKKKEKKEKKNNHHHAEPQPEPEKVIPKITISRSMIPPAESKAPQVTNDIPKVPPLMVKRPEVPNVAKRAEPPHTELKLKFSVPKVPKLEPPTESPKCDKSDVDSSLKIRLSLNKVGNESAPPLSRPSSSQISEEERHLEKKRRKKEKKERRERERREAEDRQREREAEQQRVAEEQRKKAEAERKKQEELEAERQKKAEQAAQEAERQRQEAEEKRRRKEERRERKRQRKESERRLKESQEKQEQAKAVPGKSETTVDAKPEEPAFPRLKIKRVAPPSAPSAPSAAQEPAPPRITVKISRRDTAPAPPPVPVPARVPTPAPAPTITPKEPKEPKERKTRKRHLEEPSMAPPNKGIKLKINIGGKSASSTLCRPKQQPDSPIENHARMVGCPPSSRYR